MIGFGCKDMIGVSRIWVLAGNGSLWGILLLASCESCGEVQQYVGVSIPRTHHQGPASATHYWSLWRL